MCLRSGIISQNIFIGLEGLFRFVFVTEKGESNFRSFFFRLFLSVWLVVSELSLEHLRDIGGCVADNKYHQASLLAGERASVTEFYCNRF